MSSSASRQATFAKPSSSDGTADQQPALQLFGDMSQTVSLKSIKHDLQGARTALTEQETHALLPQYEELVRLHQQCNEEIKAVIEAGSLNRLDYIQEDPEDFQSAIKYLKSVAVIVANELHPAVEYQSEEPLVSPADIGELLELIRHQLNLLKEQQTALVQYEAYAHQLLEVVQALLRHRTCSAAQLRNLTRKIRTECGVSSKITLPNLGRLLLKGQQDKQPSLLHAISAGIMTARLIASCSDVLPSVDFDIDQLMMAALLQDVGLVLLEKRCGHSPIQLEQIQPAEYELHPRYSAALAAGVQGCSTQLPELISQHHERLDGTGFPHQLQSKQLPEQSQYLAVSSAISAAIHRSQILIEIQRLHQRAMFGEYNLTYTTTLLDALGIAYRDETEQPTPTAVVQFSRFRGQKLRIESAHHQLQPGAQQLPAKKKSHRKQSARKPTT